MKNIRSSEMKNINFNSLAFMRRYFNIPDSRKLSWALIEETVNGVTEIRLGVVFTQMPHLYIDVAMRRFFTETTIFNGGLSRKVHPASRKAAKDAFIYTAENGLSMQTSKHYIWGIYFNSVYSPELLRQPLY